MLLNFSCWKHQHHSLDLRGTKAFRTSPKNLPGEHPGTLGEDLCCCPRTKQERLHEEVQGKEMQLCFSSASAEFDKCNAGTAKHVFNMVLPDRNWWRWLKPRKLHRNRWEPEVKNDKSYKKQCPSYFNIVFVIIL